MFISKRKLKSLQNQLDSLQHTLNTTLRANTQLRIDRAFLPQQEYACNGLASDIDKLCDYLGVEIKNLPAERKVVKK